MDLRKRIHGPCGKRLDSLDDINFDVELFFCRLLLFDIYFLKSIRFLEFPHLVRLIGLDAVVQLLKSNSLKIDCTPGGIGDITNLVASKSPTKKGKIKFGTYSFANINSANIKEYISDCLQCITSIDGIHYKEKKKLKRAIVDNLTTEKDKNCLDSLNNFRQDVINNHPVLKTSLMHSLKTEKGITAEESDIIIKFHKGSEIDDDFDSETNIGTLYNLNNETTHSLIAKTLMGVAGLNQRIENMKIFNSLSGFTENDLPLFEQKLSFLQDIVSPETKEKQFQKIVTITGLPDFSSITGSKTLNIDNFLKVRDSDECKEFRDWLPTIESTDDKEIEERLLSFKAKLSSSLHSPSGNVLRFLTSSSLGFLGVGEAVNVGIGVLDSFLLDKVVPKAGITTFIHKLYPSIFKGE